MIGEVLVNLIRRVSLSLLLELALSCKYPAFGALATCFGAASFGRDLRQTAKPVVVCCVSEE